jgi:hypothetical protein
MVESHVQPRRFTIDMPRTLNLIKKCPGVPDLGFGFWRFYGPSSGINKSSNTLGITR